MLAVLPDFVRTALCLAAQIKFSRSHRPAVAVALMEHMGDIVVAEPIARLARRRYPDARIFWITRAPYASLPEGYPETDHVVAVRCLTTWMLLQRLKLFNVVWDLHVGGRMCPRCNIPQAKPGVASNTEDYYDHGTLLEIQCDSAGLDRLNEGPAIVPSQAAVRFVDSLALPTRFFAIHSVSSDSSRDWPAKKWKQLVELILAAAPVEIVELGLHSLIVQQDSARQRSVCGRLTIMETAEVIRRAELFIGIDSGPAHLANAVATPGVVLLGNYRRFQSHMPYNGGYGDGTNAVILRADGPVERLSVEAVFAAVQSRAAFSAQGALGLGSRSDDKCRV